FASTSKIGRNTSDNNMNKSTSAHGRTFNLCRYRRTIPVVGADSADGAWDASPVASIQCCDVQITRKRNKLRGRSANPTITASPIMYKTRGNDHRGVRSSATNIIAVIANNAKVAATRIPFSADTIHAGNSQRSTHWSW